MVDDSSLYVRLAVVANVLDENELSPRQREIATLLVLGSSRQDAADRLGITQRTLQTHITAVFNKLGIHSRGELTGMVVCRLIDQFCK